MLERLRNLIHRNRGDLNIAGVYQAIHDMTPEQRDQVAAAVKNLSPEEVRQLEGGRQPGEMAAAAPGGGIAALLALLSGFITDPSKLTGILTAITTLIGFFKSVNPPARGTAEEAAADASEAPTATEHAPAPAETVPPAETPHAPAPATDEHAPAPPAGS